jgi:hypothetical protein
MFYGKNCAIFSTTKNQRVRAIPREKQPITRQGVPATGVRSDGLPHSRATKGLARVQGVNKKQFERGF